jgi:tetratricopeptide (TPR) repeat protein
MSDPSASARDTRVRRIVPVLGILVFCLIVWRGTVSNGYVWHDYPYLVANLALREPSNAPACFTDPAASVSPSWPAAEPRFSPVRGVSFLADFLLAGGTDAGWGHTHSLLLHLVNVLLVLALGRRLGLGFGGACFAALLFGVHPVQTEAVCWLFRRDVLLATGFALATLLVWLGGRGNPLSFWRGVGSGVLFLFACLANIQAVALIALIPILDAALGGRPEGARSRVWPVVVLFAGVGGLVLLWRWAFLSGLPAGHEVSWVTGALRGLSRVLELLLFPRVLVADYARAGDDSMALAVSSLVLGILVVGLTIRLWSIDALAAAGVAWVLVAFSASWLDCPATGFAESRVYLPVVGFVLVVSRLLARLMARPRVLVAVALGLVLAASARTASRVPDWADDARALDSVLDRAPGNWVVLRRLMEADFLSGAYARVTILARGILDLADEDPGIPRRVRTECWRFLGASCVATGATEEGKAYLARALEDPGYGWTHLDLGMLAGQTGQPDEAIRHFRLAARLLPLEPLAHFNLGVALRDRGLTDEAESAFRRAAALEWRTAEPCRTLAALLWRQEGRMDDVVAAYRRAVRLFPRDDTARYWLARAEAGWTNAVFTTSQPER